MPRATRPLNPEAVRAADESVRDQTGGRPLTMGPEDAPLRSDWMAAYQAAGGATDADTPFAADTAAGSPTIPCPAGAATPQSSTEGTGSDEDQKGGRRKKRKRSPSPDPAAKKPRKTCPPNDLCCGKGMHDPDLIADDVKAFKRDIAKKWAELKTPEARFKAVKALQEEQFQKAGVPLPTIVQSNDDAEGYGKKHPGNYGAADANQWKMTINGAIFQDPNPPDHDLRELADTMMHEGRHIEQYYRTAQSRAAGGESAADMLTKDTKTHKPLGIPKSVAESAAKSPLPKKNAKGEDCAVAKTAKAWDDAKWGKGDLSQYRPTVKYRDRPLEADAWSVGDSVKAEWDKPAAPAPAQAPSKK